MKLFHVVPKGGFGNQVIQYLAALRLVKLDPEIQISNVDLPELGIRLPDLSDGLVKYRLADAMWIETDLVLALLRSREVDAIEYHGYGQRVENLLPPSDYRSLFTEWSEDGLESGDDVLTISVRGAEILDGRHMGYLPLPTEFYADLIQRTGLKPVFVGQLGSDAYSEELRTRFPHAVYQPSQGPRKDFATLLRAKNLVPSISTFSWLACWLSRADAIHLPLLGIYNPLYGAGHDFAPIDDARFQFWWFPAAAGSPVTRYRHVHAALAGRWRPMAAAELAALKQTSTRKREIAPCLRHYDESYYLGRYQDVRHHVPKTFPNGLVHYIRSGFHERRLGWGMDQAAYLVAYPDAARRIGRGEFTDVHHHFAEEGAELGYNPSPPVWG